MCGIYCVRYHMYNIFIESFVLSIFHLRLFRFSAFFRQSWIWIFTLRRTKNF